MPTDPIRIRITPRAETPPMRDRREAFWAAHRAALGQEETSPESVASDEAKLTREFGPELRRVLVHHLSEPLRALDSELFPRNMLDLEHWFFRFMNEPRERYGYQFADAFARLIEQRQQVLRESPAVQRAQERMAAAGGVTFSARVAGYSSLNLDLSVGSFKQVAKAFEEDFDSFRVFLEAFVPVAFAGVFSQVQADRLDFTITVPGSVEQAFRSAVRESSEGRSAASTVATATGVGSGRERAEWLWKLANGSLLLPVLLALFVMYQGMKMLSEIRGSQYEAVRPVLEHQLKLLEEDRLRLADDAARNAAAKTPPATETK